MSADPTPASPAGGTDPNDITETATPGTGSPFTTVATHADVTRRYIAYGLVALLGALAILGAVGWLLHGCDVERVQSYATIFAPVVTLVGTVLGFYFSRSER